MVHSATLGLLPLENSVRPTAHLLRLLGDITMTTHPCGSLGCTLLLLAGLPVPALGQAEKASYAPPKDITFRKATIISEGTRLAAELFALESNTDKALPTIIMCHGWGGVAAQLRPDAVAFARAGYFVVTFDWRGWGASEGR